jgi:hypothetical protein
MSGMSDPFLIRAQEIDEILAHPDSFTANRLMQRYDIDSDKDTFVLAMIGALMTESKKARARRA